MIKRASEMLNIMCIEKEAGLADGVKNGIGIAKNIMKDTASDVKRAAGIEKFVPKHDVSSNALKGAIGGGVVGAAGGVATNSGENKDNKGAAVKGGLLGAVTGAALGAGGSHYLNSTDHAAFKAQNSAFKRGFATGTATGVAGATAGKEGAQAAVNAVKNSDMAKNVTQKATDLADKAGTSINKSVDTLKSTTNKYVDSGKKKLQELDRKLSGHK